MSGKFWNSSFKWLNLSETDTSPENHKPGFAKSIVVFLSLLVQMEDSEDGEGWKEDGLWAGGWSEI